MNNAARGINRKCAHSAILIGDLTLKRGVNYTLERALSLPPPKFPDFRNGSESDVAAPIFDVFFTPPEQTLAGTTRTSASGPLA